MTDDVKNYKQYGYDDSIRKTALEILKTKGFEEDDLKFTGNDINYKYERAIEISRVNKRNYGTVFLYIFIWLFILVIGLSVLFGLLKNKQGIAQRLLYLISFIMLIKYYKPKHEKKNDLITACFC